MIQQQHAEIVQPAELRYLPELPAALEPAAMKKWWSDVRSVLERAHQSATTGSAVKNTLLATVSGASGAQPTSCTWSISAGKLVLSYQLGSETHYVYLPLDGNATTWTHTTTL